MLELEHASLINVDELYFDFEIKGSGSQEEYDRIIADVQRISANCRTIAYPVKLKFLKLD